MKSALPELVAIPDNPIPPSVSVREVTAVDGVRLRIAHWQPAGDATPGRGVVIILQGRGEFIEKYFEVVAELRQRGFHVVAFDWRGQGGSQRLLRRRGRTPVQPGHVRDFADYQHDLDAVLADVAALLPDLPRFALCHSMGGAIALLRAATEGHGGDFARIVAIAPMIALSPAIAPSFAPAVVAVGRNLGLSRLIIPGGRRAATVMRPFVGNRLTSDRVRFDRIRAVIAQAPWLAVGDPTVGWLAAAFRAMAQLSVPRFALSVATPALVVAAGADRIVSTPATERFGSRLKAGNAVVLPYAKHEILMENDDIRAVFWAAFDAFVPGQGLVDGGDEIRPGDGNHFLNKSDA
ncbi:lysophospholipase [Pseudochelatococcus lubricantis]|uniref:Lysophospholipase n=1 Tax=Pseudochelatococcus lubricantis TaxID=1538102 RepID=A0ABX0V2Q5_9HYPH|nr:alpha/beta hydrolase [Pseudochelatococcus lubricantis]NIJ59431.1 lysophospholipase [Pseudochelatococcus lubricantis]